MSQYLRGPQHEVFSTPPTSPAPISHRPLARKPSRPISLHLAKKQAEWVPDIQLATSPEFNNPKSTASLTPQSAVLSKSDNTIMSAAADSQPFHPPHLFNKVVPSPCFVHSQLDSGMLASEYFKSKQQQLLPNDLKDVGLANSLQHLSHGIMSNLDTPFDDDEDELGNTLTKCLAETAVAVRDMSKQLGQARIQSNIQSVLIVTKARDNRLIKLTRQLALYLMLKRRPGAARGLVVYVDSQLRHSRRFDAEGLKRDHPDLFIPFPRQVRRVSSTNSLSSVSSSSTHTALNDEGQLRYWTSNMCRNNSHWFDFVITLGGDGTVLFTSWLFQRIVPPVLSFALGSLGFLTNFDFAKHADVMDSVIDNGIRVNLRMRFTCTVYRAVANSKGKQHEAVKKGDTGEILMKNLEEGGWEAIEGGWSGGTVADGKAHGRDKHIMCFTTRPVETFEVLNDLVVDRGPSPYVSQLELFGDEHHMTTVQADGLTVATPTGSTAYSLSAGGSLTHPEIPAMLITPICPHTLSFRPMLLPDTMELRICVPYNSRSTAWASFDGRGRVEIKQGDHIKVTASKYPFPTVCAHQQSSDWFQAISRTLKWNERERQKSFVVVEEDAPPRVRKSKRRSNDATQAVPATATSPEDDEEDESSEEEEKYDIDDSAPEAEVASNGTGITDVGNVAGIEKTKKLTLSNRKRSKSRSPARVSSSPSPPPSGVMSPTRYATKPPFSTSRHVGFDVPSSPSDSSDGSDATHEGTRDNIRPSYHHSAKIRMPKDRDFDFDHIKTPTAGHHGHRPKAVSQSESRVFAVRGHDESDSATSDNDS